MSRASAAPILFFATGVAGSDGGIASANRNVLAALRQVGEETGRPVRTLVLGETGGDRDYRTFGGRKGRFAMATLASMPAAGLAVFDHAHIARPILALPRGFGPPIVVCAHGSEASWRLRPSSTRVYRRADLVLTNSSFTLQRMRAAVSRFRGASCPLGLPPQFVVSTSPPEPSMEEIVLQAADGTSKPLGRRVLLLVARMDATEREKGHRELLDVMPALRDRYAEVQLVFAGAGTDLPKLKAQAAASPAAANIFFTGRASDALLATLYAKAFAYVMPSRQEGFGLVYLEAAAAGLPSIATRVGGVPDAVLADQTGLLVEPTVTAVAGSIKSIVEVPRQRAQYAAAARDHARRLSWKRCASRTYALPSG